MLKNSCMPDRKWWSPPKHSVSRRSTLFTSTIRMWKDWGSRPERVRLWASLVRWLLNHINFVFCSLPVWHTGLIFQQNAILDSLDYMQCMYFHLNPRVYTGIDGGENCCTSKTCKRTYYWLKSLTTGFCVFLSILSLQLWVPLHLMFNFFF